MAYTREQRNAYRRAYHSLNPEYQNTLSKKYYRAHKAQLAIKQKEYAAKNQVELSVYARRYKLKYKYNLTPEQFEAMFVAQDGTCAICKDFLKLEQSSRIKIDHDHVYNKVRAILCDRCNRGLGQFRDNPDLLRWAAKYLDRYRKEHKM